MAETEFRAPRRNHIITQGILAVTALVALYHILRAYPDSWTMGEWLQLTLFFTTWLAASSNVYCIVRHEDQNHNFSGFVIVMYFVMACLICGVSVGHQTALESIRQKSGLQQQTKNVMDYCFLPALCTAVNLFFSLYYRLSPGDYLAALANCLFKRRTGTFSREQETSDPLHEDHEQAGGEPAASGAGRSDPFVASGVSPRIIESIFAPLGNLAAVSQASQDEERNYIAGVMTRLRLGPQQRLIAHQQIKIGKTSSPSAAFRRISHSALAAEGSEFHERAFRMAAVILFAGGSLEKGAQRRFDMAADAFHVSQSSRDEIRTELQTLFRRS